MTNKSFGSSNDRIGNGGSSNRRSSRPSLLKAITSLLGFTLLGGAVLALLALGVYMLHLDSIIRTQFEGRRWALPAHVYARPLELFKDMHLSAEQFAKELQMLDYRSVEQPYGPGTYSRDGESFELITRDFTFWDGTEVSQQVQVNFEDQTLTALESLETGQNLDLLRMESAKIAGIYPSHYEDRILVKHEEIPEVLVDTLIAVEDRSFYKHFGVDLRGISRAFLANLRAGRTVQGGSTLTQQLVKNYFLSNERTLTRKINEALMAILVEWDYDKDEILEVYSNEVYLGQDGRRAIHGLGLASRFYFQRPLAELNLHHIALLVGLVRGPSQYDPRRHPEQAKERRSLVLNVMVKQGLISAADAATAEQMPLDVGSKVSSAITPYPAFVDLVKRQLRQYYKEEDLTSEGLKVFTNLDPHVQAVAEQAIIDQLPKLEKSVRLKPDLLQSSTVVVNTQTGEVLAVVGGRDVNLAGFNRALDAKRPAGSLLKPAVYLTALEQPENYTLVTRLNDATPIVYTGGGEVWAPANYDKRYHGRVQLRDALARSYNIATARLGLELDVLQVIETMKRLGIERDLKPFPSLLLGAVDLAPIEVAQMYQTFASGGYRMPLRAIRQVTADNGELLQPYPLSPATAIEPGPAYLITTAMQRVVQTGTARVANKQFSPDLGIAGKTGTTDDLRDSWFAGFSGNILTVVWLGRDDNKPAKLSGARGALKVWIELMRHLHLEPLDLPPPPDIEMARIDPRNGLRASRRCRRAESVPFLDGSIPYRYSSCGAGGVYAKRAEDPKQDTAEPSASAPAPVIIGQPQPKQPPPSSNPIKNFFKKLLE